jgi:hypothetical protein
VFKNLKPESTGLIQLPSHHALLVIKNIQIPKHSSFNYAPKQSDLSTFGVAPLTSADRQLCESFHLETKVPDIQEHLLRFKNTDNISLQIDTIDNMLTQGNVFIVLDGECLVFSLIFRLHNF